MTETSQYSEEQLNRLKELDGIIVEDGRVRAKMLQMPTI